MEDIYLIDPDLNIPDSDSDELDDVTRTITPAQTEEVPSEDICTVNSTGLTAHKLITAQQGLTCSGGFLTTSPLGIKFSDNTIQTTAALGSDYFNWISKTSSFIAEINKRYIVFGNNTPTSLVVTLPTAFTDSVVYIAVDYSTGTGFKILPDISDTIEGSSFLIVDSTVIDNKDIVTLIYQSGNWKIYDVNFGIDTGSIIGATGFQGATGFTGSTGFTGATGSVSAVGLDTQVIYNSSGSLAGSANLTFDGTRLTAAALTVDTNTLYVDATNDRVGIGTTSPSRTMEIVGDMILSGGDTGNFKLTVSDGTTNTIVHSAGGWSTYGSITNHPVRFLSNASEKMRIDSSGNVGIGTTSPSSLFNVVNSVGGYTTGLFENNANYNGITITSKPNLSGYNDSAIIFGLNSTIGGSITNLFAIGAENTDGTGNTKNFYIYDTVYDTYRLYIDDGGAVGIGTTNPQAGKLNVYGKTLIGAYDSGATISGGQLELRSAGATESRLDIWQAGVALGSIGSPASSSVFYIVNNYSATGLIPGNGIAIATDGNVGIGTSSPAAKLDVVGNLLLSGQSTAEQYIKVGYGRSGNGYSYIDLQGDTTYGYGTRLIRGDTGANAISSLEHRGTGDLRIVNYEAAPICFYTSSSEKVRIDSSGNVGIGTSSPGNTKLNILYAGSDPSLTATATAGMFVGVAGYAGLAITESISSPYTVSLQARHQSVDNLSYPISLNPLGGNVGIGTASPSYLLDVNGNARIVTSLGVGTTPSGTTGEIRATNNITAYYSDQRLKQNIALINNPLEKVSKISGVTFTQNKLAENFGYTDYSQQVGVIAQEIQAVLPEAVTAAPFDIAEDGTSKSGENYLTVRYEKLVPLLIEAIKELSAKVKELENK